jgi:hypothetical protein
MRLVDSHLRSLHRINPPPLSDVCRSVAKVVPKAKFSQRYCGPFTVAELNSGGGSSEYVPSNPARSPCRCQCANSEKAVLAARQSLSQAQQRASEWEKRAATDSGEKAFYSFICMARGQRSVSCPLFQLLRESVRKPDINRYVPRIARRIRQILWYLPRLSWPSSARGGHQDNCQKKRGRMLCRFSSQHLQDCKHV